MDVGRAERHQTLTTSATSNMGGHNGVVDRRLLRYIGARPGPLPGWTMGYGFDVFEWSSSAMQEAWHTYQHQHLGWHHFLGSRGRKNEVATSQFYEGLDYVGYEQHQTLYDFNGWVATMLDRPGRPSFTEDRFRIRNNPTHAAKDLSADRTRTLMWELNMAGGLAAIWGNLLNVDGQSAGEASHPYPNKAQLRTHGTFWNTHRRFRADLHVNQTLSNNSMTRILVNSARSHWVLYRRDASNLHINLTGATGTRRAIAVNTKAAYAETDLGLLSASAQTITFPFTSDWAVAIGDFALD